MRFTHISIGTKDAHMMNGAVRGLNSEGHSFEFRCFDASDLDDDPHLLAEALEFVRGSDVLTLKVHGDTSYFKKFDRLEKVISDYGVCTLLDCTDQGVTDSFCHLFTRSREEYNDGIAYLKLGGDDNYTSLLKWA